MKNLRRARFAALIILILPCLPMAHALSPPLPRAPAPASNRAVIISSLDLFSPMRKVDLANLENSLTSAGYTVTYVKDGDVTVNFLTTQLNNYRVIIWRTDAYEHAHTVYWYLGQQVSQALRQAYASDLSSGELDSSDGVMGADVKFFNDSFNAGMLSNVRLLIIVSSMSSMLAPCFITAGVQSIIDFSNTIDMQFNWVDYLTTGIVRLLAEGYSVADAVSDVITPLLTMRLEDPLDAMEIPSVSYSGNYALTIT